MRSKNQNSIQNRILASLPRDELDRLKPQLQSADLILGQLLSKSGQPLDHVYFPQQGMISLVRPMRDGAVVEVGVVGREGFVGMGAVLGKDSNALGAMAQSADCSALTIPLATLQAELDRTPVLHMRLLHFVQAFMAQVSQSAACNGRHHVQERLARWLLMAGDRNTNDGMFLKHEFLSMMLGVRRPGISVALGVFKNAGLIRYAQGRIEILDRAGLEAASCECYGEVRKQYRRLLS